MKVLQNRSVTLTVLAVVISLTALYGVLRIPSTEGFNPGDDGVILAQSYRILHGEVPHRDFISIRPAGSAFMHLVNFISPLPLELSARWLTWFEYLATAILITAVLAGSWFRGLRKPWYRILTAGSVIVMFVLNQNHYNLFPWTTIDSLFWFSLALYAWFRLKKAPLNEQFLWQAILVFAATFSALCRQTFALPALLLFIRMVYWNTVNLPGGPRKAMVRLLPALVAGMLPGWLYAGMLTATGSWAPFIQQMTGRSGFWETGVAKFAESFWQLPLPFLFLAAIVAGLVRRWRSDAGLDVHLVNLFILALKAVSSLLKVAMVFAAFLKPEWLFAISLSLFWMLVLDLFLLYIHNGKFPAWAGLGLWIALAAWTSAISPGDNAPVFALGWIAGGAILLQIRDYYDRFYRKVRRYQVAAAGILIPALLILSISVQRRVNYRDLPAGDLTRDGGEIFSGLKGVDLSEKMADYLTEINRIYKQAGNPAGAFTVWPNNALIYTLLGSPNPFPLDWMQAAEYEGSEGRLESAVAEVIRTKNPLILVEKSNIKRIMEGEVSVSADSPDYPYLRLLDSLAEPVEMDSKWFRAYRKK